jgi:hypothetical protein
MQRGFCKTEPTNEQDIRNLWMRGCLVSLTCPDESSTFCYTSSFLPSNSRNELFINLWTRDSRQSGLDLRFNTADARNESHHVELADSPPTAPFSTQHPYFASIHFHNQRVRTCVSNPHKKHVVAPTHPHFGFSRMSPPKRLQNSKKQISFGHLANVSGRSW